MISIAVIDKNIDYAERLAEVLQQNNELQVSRYSNLENFQKAQFTQKYDIVLYDPNLTSERMAFPQVKLAVCLYSEEAENAFLYKDMPQVLKYQRISRIYKEVLKLYVDKAGYAVDFGNAESTKLIGVYSPVGGSGKTTLALALALSLKASGASVLFMSMEQLDSSSVLMPDGDGSDSILALIQAVSDPQIQTKLSLDSIVNPGHGGIDYVNGFHRLVDYKAVNGDEIKNVLEEVKRLSNYRYVILDMQSVLDDIGYTVAECADKLVIVERGGEIAERKLAMFETQKLVKEYQNKMVKVINFADQGSHSKSLQQIPSIGSVHAYAALPLATLIHNIDVNQEISIDAFTR